MTLAAIRPHELVRKAIHLTSAAIPLLYWFILDREIMLKGVIFLSMGFLTVEYLRLSFPTAKGLFLKVFGAAIRDHEQKNLTGATYVFTGAVLTIFLFPKQIAVPSLLILSISDTVAALVGIPFGKHKFLAKSMEGSFSFFVSSILILFYFSPESIVLNVLVAAILTIAEAFPMKLDDNFLIPLLSGSLLSIATLI